MWGVMVAVGLQGFCLSVLESQTYSVWCCWLQSSISCLRWSLQLGLTVGVLLQVVVSRAAGLWLLDLIIAP